MMPWFIWKGKNSLADFGLWIGKLPKRVRSQERHEEIDIPGRAGSLIMLEGEDIYSAYQDEITVVARNTLQMDKIMEWLRGSSELILFNDKDKARSARIVGEVAFRRISNDLQQAVIPFFFQPFRKLVLPETISITGASASIYNPGDIASKPTVSITGSGNNTITIGGKAMTFALGSSSITISVDCDAHIVTKNNAIWTGTYSGDFWTIPKGASTVTQTGGDSLSIQPNWRWL